MYQSGNMGIRAGDDFGQWQRGSNPKGVGRVPIGSGGWNPVSGRGRRSGRGIIAGRPDVILQPGAQERRRRHLELQRPRIHQDDPGRYGNRGRGGSFRAGGSRGRPSAGLAGRRRRPSTGLAGRRRGGSSGGSSRRGGTNPSQRRRGIVRGAGSGPGAGDQTRERAWLDAFKRRGNWRDQYGKGKPIWGLRSRRQGRSAGNRNRGSAGKPSTGLAGRRRRGRSFRGRSSIAGSRYGRPRGGRGTVAPRRGLGRRGRRAQRN